MVENGGNTLQKGVELKYMKILKTIAFISIVSVGMTTSVFASWWNPFSWNMFKKQNKVVVEEKVVENSAQTYTAPTSTIIQNEPNFLICNGSKYNKCLEGQNFICPTNGEDAFCEKIKDDEIKTPKTKETSIVKPATVVISKKADVQPKKEPVGENFNITILSVADSLIRTYTDYIAFYKKFDVILMEREQESLQTKQKIDKLLNSSGSAMDSQYYNVYVLLSNLKSDELSYIKSLRAANQQNISNLENFLLKLKQYRTEKEGSFYSRNAATQEAKELMPLYDKLDPYMESFSTFKEGYFSYINKNDDIITTVVTRMQESLSVEISSLESQRRNVSKSAPPIQITIPKIELPKMPTTIYCDTRYTGFGGNYTTSCTER